MGRDTKEERNNTLKESGFPSAVYIRKHKETKFGFVAAAGWELEDFFGKKNCDEIIPHLSEGKKGPREKPTTRGK